ncbi:unnamed protein product [Acanthoscelides obtectus]|uniref:Integrase catalytic domain-containing protein n=1 Tax=Acanthoscelides obtectus TaxID=200917 RepID=A0A9P0JSW8_ACAOB|nr:unnamed protein product [Acanthoscelides obtectus]CAK1634011.1 PiggyBac transposable element-derived protein 4 [Acanthoscelides obtectus]
MSSDSSDLDYDPVDDSVSDEEDEFSYNSRESDVEAECVTFEGWIIVPHPEDDKRLTDVVQPTLHYDVHPAVVLEEVMSPMKCFETFVSETIVTFLCKWTNERAAKYFLENIDKNMKVHGLRWRDVTVSEMYVFIALVLMQGLIHLPHLSDYWRKDFLLAGPQVFSATIMSRDRFLSIMKFLRFSDPKATDPSRPMTRLAMFFAFIKENTMIAIDPGETFALDECLMLYKGRLHFKQYIKSKRSRFGIKLFALCPSDPKFRGYTYSFALYIGRDIYNVAHIPGTDALSMSERVVVYMLSNLLDEGREVILDNWYVSVRLVEFLLTRNTYVSDTIRTNRGVPSELTQLQLKKGQSCFIRKGDVLIVRYKDKKDVYVITSKLTADFVQKDQYSVVDKRVVVLQKPSHVDHYNSNMGAVDATDQDMEPYNAARKSYAWFKKVGIHVLQRMVLNAKVLYSVTNKRKVDMKDFTLQLCDEILAKHLSDYTAMRDQHKNAKRQKLSEPSTSRLAGHELVRSEQNTRRRCWVFSRISVVLDVKTAYHCVP